MRRIFTYTILLFICSTLQGCNKAKNDKWIVANVHVYDAVTGAPLEAEIKLQRIAIGGGSGNNPIVLESYVTNSDGYVHVEYELSNDDKTGQIRFQVKTVNNLSYIYPYAAISIQNVSKTSENKVEFPLEPWYSFNLSALNSNCTSPTDSVWINFDGGQIYSSNSTMLEGYGCADTSYAIYPWQSIIINSSNQIDFQIITKKSGVVNTYSETYNLNLGTITPIVIEY